MSSLPAGLVRVLPADTARTWHLIADHLPDGLVLYGGTAIAAHLQHRRSRDLDFFFTDPVDLVALAAALSRLGTFAPTRVEVGTLNGLLNRTKVQFLSTAGQTPLAPPIRVAGVPVAGLRDLAVTKLKVIGDRGELRDYFDLMLIEQRAGILVERTLTDVRARYGTQDVDTLLHLIRALGSFSDVADDVGLPMARSQIEDYWRARQPWLLASLDVTGTQRLMEQPVEAEMLVPESDIGPEPSRVWVAAHSRNGRRVGGYWRRR